MRARQHEQPRQRFLRGVGDVRRRPAELLQAEVASRDGSGGYGVTVVSIVLYCAIRSGGPMICTQPELKPASTRLSSLNESSPFSCSHKKPDCLAQASGVQ